MESQSNSEVKLFGLVRDKEGKPKFDDINNINPVIWSMLSFDEQAEVIKQRGS